MMDYYILNMNTSNTTQFITIVVLFIILATIGFNWGSIEEWRAGDPVPVKWTGGSCTGKYVYGLRYHAGYILCTDGRRIDNPSNVIKGR